MGNEDSLADFPIIRPVLELCLSSVSGAGDG